jgi:hypothetical protein
LKLQKNVKAGDKLPLTSKKKLILSAQNRKSAGIKRLPERQHNEILNLAEIKSSSKQAQENTNTRLTISRLIFHFLIFLFKNIANLFGAY